jgi:hypothetical protein
MILRFAKPLRHAQRSSTDSSTSSLLERVSTDSSTSSLLERFSTDSSTSSLLENLGRVSDILQIALLTNYLRVMKNRKDGVNYAWMGWNQTKLWWHCLFAYTRKANTMVMQMTALNSTPRMLQIQSHSTPRYNLTAHLVMTQIQAHSTIYAWYVYGCEDEYTHVTVVMMSIRTWRLWWWVYACMYACNRISLLTHILMWFASTSYMCHVYILSSTHKCTTLHLYVVHVYILSPTHKCTPLLFWTTIHSHIQNKQICEGLYIGISWFMQGRPYMHVCTCLHEDIHTHVYKCSKLQTPRIQA